MDVGGANTRGQLGMQLMENCCIPTLIPNTSNFVQLSAGRQCTLALDCLGRVWSFGANESGQLGLGDEENRFRPCLIESLPNAARAVVAGNKHSIVLDVDGNAWSFGANSHGELGIGAGPKQNSPCKIDHNDIVTISSGFAHNLFLDSQGRVWSFGCLYLDVIDIIS
jgi:alpha-tubulin suppressor-like RCC1 family protein